MAEVKIKTTDGNNAVTLAGPASGADVTLKLPTAAGSAGQYLKTDGSNGQLSFATVASPVTALNNATANELVTVGSTTTELDAEANLTFDGTDLTLGTGNLIVGTAGKGIDFSANTASSASGISTANELLDHYEEGTWTPEFLSSWPAGGTNKGTYVRVGSIVTATGWIVGSTTGRTGNANAAVKNLPFALSYNGNSNRACAAIGYTKGINLTGSNLQLVTTVSQNATQFALYLIEDNASASVTKEQDMTGTVQFEFSITYTVH